MATFKVGQRVRKVRPVPWSTPVSECTIPIGAECIVHSFALSCTEKLADMKVRWSGWPTALATRQDCFEPILYDGNQVISWDACIWNPSHIHKDRIAERLTDHAKILDQPRRSAIIGDQP